MGGGREAEGRGGGADIVREKKREWEIEKERKEERG